MRLRLIAALFAGLIASPVLAQGDAWPNRPITLMGGFPNGAGTDIYARRLAEPLSRALGQPVVVDNRGGANGFIARDITLEGEGDGGHRQSLGAENRLARPTLKQGEHLIDTFIAQYDRTDDRRSAIRSKRRRGGRLTECNRRPAYQAQKTPA